MAHSVHVAEDGGGGGRWGGIVLRTRRFLPSEHPENEISDPCTYPSNCPPSPVSLPRTAETNPPRLESPRRDPSGRRVVSSSDCASQTVPCAPMASFRLSQSPGFPESCEHCPSFPPVPGRAVTSHRRAPRLLCIRRGRWEWGRGRAARERCAGVGRGRAPQRARAGELPKCVTSSSAQSWGGDQFPLSTPPSTNPEENIGGPFKLSSKIKSHE